MREYEEKHSDEEYPPKAVMLDIQNGEEHSATPGDYFWVKSDEELFTVEDGIPLALVIKKTTFVDALTGKELDE
jgi:hypothetical protein